MRVQRGWVLVGGVVFFWSALWWLGAPLTGDDDLFFIGPALQLHSGEPLANPLIRFWHAEATDTFFYQPPFFQYALAAWLTIFGVSAGSIAGFQCAAGAGASMAAGLLLRRLQLRGAWFVLLVIGAAMLSKGMRHDILGLAVLFGGLALLTYRTRATVIAGSAMLVAAPLTWPVLVCYAVPLGIAVLLHRRQEAQPALPQLLGWIAAGALVTGTLFLLAIDFAVLDFVRVFLWHADSRRLPGLLREVVFQLTGGRTELLQGPAYLLTIGLMVIVLTHRRRYAMLAGLVVAVLVATSLNVVAYSSALQMAAWPFLALTMGVLALNMVRPTFTRGARAASLALVAVLLWANALNVANWLAVRPLSADYYRNIAAQLPTDQCLGIDAAAARYVFDYRLPACAFAWHYSYPPPKFYPREDDTPAFGTAWVTSHAPLGHTAGVAPEDRLVIRGIRLESIPTNRMQIRITPSAPSR